MHALKNVLWMSNFSFKSSYSDFQFSSMRDQGFHRAIVLIILPTRETARRTVHQILHLMPEGSTVCHRKRFEREFGPGEGQADQDKRKGKKPPDYEEWFSCMNSYIWGSI